MNLPRKSTIQGTKNNYQTNLIKIRTNLKQKILIIKLNTPELVGAPIRREDPKINKISKIIIIKK